MCTSVYKLLRLTLVILVCVLHQGCSLTTQDRDIVLKIANIPQPFNCSLFLDNLEELLEETVAVLAATSGDVIEHAEVEVPRHWDFSRCMQGERRGARQTSYSRRPRAPDILLGDNHPTYQSLPWALQHRGCAEKGLYVNLPEGFVGHQDQISDLKSKGAVLTRELVKYLYGVFSEAGYLGDRLYPAQFLEGNQTLDTVSCQPQTNQPFCPAQDYDDRVPTKQNLLCDGVSAYTTIQAEHRRSPAPQPDSALLPNPSTASVLYPEESGLTVHDAPGAGGPENSTGSAWSQEPDGPGLAALLSQTTPTPPSEKLDRSRRTADGVGEEERRLTFTYALSSTTKYHVLLDQSAGMADENRWIHVKRALFRFIDLLPVGSRLNILAFASVVKEVLPTTTVTELNRDGLFGRIPRRVLDDVSACVECALKEALRGVGHNEVVILISGAHTQLSSHARVLKQVLEEQVPIYVVTYPATLHPSFIPLACYGGVYAVVGNSLKLHPLTHLQEILANIITRTEGETVEKLHESHYNSLAFAGTFNYDTEDSTDLIITLNVPDEEKVEFFEVKDPSGKKRIFSKFEDGMVYFKFSGNVPSGIWSYHAKLYHDSVFPDTKMSVDVITKGDSNAGIAVDIFATEPCVTSTGKPVILFAKIQRHGLPILGAKATAELYMPGGAEDGSMYTLDLHDNGLGYPDITAGDGVYSAYVPGYGMEPGFYSIRLIVSDNNGQAVQPKGQSKEFSPPVEECCGSEIPYGNSTAPTGTFIRLSAGPSFYVSQGVPLASDIAPPVRISDLRLVTDLLGNTTESLRLSNESLLVDLAWTAPGGDYDFGKAHKYEIRCHTSPSMLGEQTFTEKGILVHSETVPAPQTYGTPQSSSVSVPWPNQIFYYAMVAVDEHGNRGPISNLVSVYVHEVTTTTAATTPALPPPSAGLVDGLHRLDLLSYLQASSNDSLATDPYLREKFLKLSENLVELKGSNAEIYIATGIVCGVVIVIVVILILLVLMNRRKRSLSPVPVVQASTTSSTSYKEVDEKPASLGQVSKLSTDGSSKVLLSWLDSLPKSEEKVLSPSPPSSHNTSMESTLNTISRRNHTLTKTNPYRHKVLTNGSFVSLKDIPSGSEEGSTRLTSSTLDDSNGSDTSSGSHNNVGLTSKSLKITTTTAIKRSNTSASSLRQDNTNPTTNNLRRSHNTGYYSFRDYSPVYATATLARGYRTNLSVLAEDSLHGTMRPNPNQARRTKRTESFV